MGPPGAEQGRRPGHRRRFGPASPSNAPDARDPRIGTHIAGFTILSLIGRGGMGVVYLAEHGRLGRRVALKLLAPELIAAEEVRRRFIQREPQLAASVEHPNVLPIHDAGEEPDGTLWMAMRYVDGRDLGRLLRDQGALGLPRTLQLLGQVADALDAAHDQGLIHRDVKPENILIEGAPPREHVYLTDFGLTRSISSGRFTATGAFLGSVHYASPEVIEGRADIDGRADVYSLGCLLFRCLSGRVPFPQPSDISILYAHLMTDPPNLLALRSELPAAMNDVIRTALAKRPEDRYPSCGSLLEAARAASDPSVTVTYPAGDTSATVPDTAGAISAQLIPLVSTGRKSARHQVRIENVGRSAMEVRLEARAATGLSVSISPGRATVDPGSVAWAGLRARALKSWALWRRRFPFQVEVDPEGAEPTTLHGTVVRPTPTVGWAAILAVVLGLGGVAAYALTRTPTADQRSPGVPTTGAVDVVATCPLTGQPVPTGVDPNGPALAVKVDNQKDPLVRPQSGLFRADLVFEVPIEFDRTRFVAVFHCSMPDLVGPVRGPRPTDPELLAQLGRPLFAFGNDSLAEPLDLSGVVEASERVEPNGYSRTDAGAPFNLFAEPQALLATRSSDPPVPMFAYSTSPPAGLPSRTVIKVRYENLLWRYDEGPGLYFRYYGSRPHESDGRPLTASNVIVQRVRITEVPLAGEIWLHAHTIGSGTAVVFRDGLVIRGTWRRSFRSNATVFLDEEGRAITLAPGVTWIELVPAS